ncbi:hypothetical protein GCM10009819_25630 [Agromyces tropicus]|uniref:Uncharacterized protein n=1 Tax=Agromyces tropicus TaxID=555371 RepID=A0ABP5G6T7_9MICO
MTSDDERRTELLARVHSRAGRDDPRTEQVDPETGEVRWLTESERDLLALEPARAPLAGRRGARAVRGVDEASEGPDPTGAAVAPPSPRRRVLARSRAALVVGVAAGMAAWALVAWTGGPPTGTSSDAAPVEIAVVPHAPIAAGEASGGSHGARGPGPMAVFHDPERSRGSLPGWLEPTFPSSRVAQVVGPDGPITGIGVYAVTSPDRVACLIVRIEAKRMVWDCIAVRTLAVEGLVMRTPIPAGLGAAGDPDDDGVSGDAAVADLLVAEWHADGTFLVRHVPG